MENGSPLGAVVFVCFPRRCGVYLKMVTVLLLWYNLDGDRKKRGIGAMSSHLRILFISTPFGFLTIALGAWIVAYCIGIAGIPQADLRLQKSIGGTQAFCGVIMCSLLVLFLTSGKDDPGSGLLRVASYPGIALGVLGILGLWWATKRGRDSKRS